MHPHDEPIVRTRCDDRREGPAWGRRRSAVGYLTRPANDVATDLRRPGVQRASWHTRPVRELHDGSILAGYRLERLLGRGGMGEVWLARDNQLDRRVALKLIVGTLSYDPDFRQRFLRETRLAAALDHPHIVPVYEAGEFEGELYLAMRYVEGSDLHAVVATGGPLEAGRAVGLLTPEGSPQY